MYVFLIFFLVEIDGHPFRRQSASKEMRSLHLKKHYLIFSIAVV